MTTEDMRELGTIHLLDKVLTRVGVIPEDASSFCAPLKALRYLRVADAHKNRGAVEDARRTSSVC